MIPLRCLSLLLMAFLAGEALAQNAVLRGYVRDLDDGQPMQGVNVILTNEGDAFLGAASDRDGFFAVSGIVPGRYFLEGRFVGYIIHRDTLDLAADEIRTYNFDLMVGAGQFLEETIVEAEREGAGAAGLTAGLQSITPRDIALIPSPDLSGDLATYLAALPGVVSTGDQGGQLFIRGGEPTQNQVLMDGMVVYQPFHLIGFYSAFPASILNVTDVYAGGFGAEYGGRLSSVIDISTRNGNKRELAGEFSAAPFISAGLIEGPIVPGRMSALVSGRFSVIEQGAARFIDTPLPYDFNDQFGKLHVDLSENSQASITGLRSFDRGIIGARNEAEADSVKNEVTWENQAIGARYVLLPTRIPVQAELLMSLSNIENRFGPAEAPTRTSMAQEINVASNVTHYAGSLDLSWGLYFRFSELTSELGGLFQDVSDDTEFISETGGYIRLGLQTGDEASGILRFEPGLRVASFPSKGNTYLEPRARLTADLGIHRFSIAGGLYHQEIVGLTDRRDAGDVFTAWTSSPIGDVPEAVHAIGGYQVRPTAWLRLAVEIFYKSMSNLSIAEWSAFPRFTTRLQPADGTVYGLDSRLEINAGPFNGFINYGYSEVEYNARQTEIQYWFGSSEYTFAPPHDRRHQLNAVGSLSLAGFTFNVRWQYGSGLPFSEALGFDEFLVLEGPTDLFAHPGETRVLYTYPYGGHLPSYHRLDLSLEKSFDLPGGVAISLLASGTNAYDRTNLFYIDLFTLDRLNQLPLIPAFGVKLSF
ncbi:MAG: TonB-dependent receptor [Bacteroidota bacterium]|nr:TonB-dependent receptor [Bacteroidota bacterium]